MTTLRARVARNDWHVVARVAAGDAERPLACRRLGEDVVFSLSQGCAPGRTSASTAGRNTR